MLEKWIHVTVCVRAEQFIVLMSKLQMAGVKLHNYVLCPKF